jgi:glycosyltransferase involved in cell wall biosynthesis
MKILFLTLARINSIDSQGIYPDLLRKFRDNGHEITIVNPTERKFRKSTSYISIEGVNILNVWTTNFQKTNIIEKGITTLLIEFYYYIAIRKYLCFKDFDLILYSTPPITFTNLIKKLKKNSSAKTYLLLKDIFPQNAVDLELFGAKSLIYKYFRNQEKILYNISDFIGCMSNANKLYILKHNPYLNESKVEINPNSVYLRNIKSNENATDIKLPDNKIIFVYGGNLGKPQGLDFLLDIILDNSENTNAFFLVVGSGTESARIKKWFDKIKPLNAKFISELQSTEYNQLLKQCHVGLVFLNPNFTIPNYPSRILNYMENRLPILFAIDVNTDVGVDAEFYNYGLWCENGDLIKFRNYLNFFINENDKRIEMGINGFKRLNNDFNVENSYNIIMSHFLK